MLRGRKIGLIVTGSIAAYKAVALVRELSKLGAEVQVAMTKGAQQFVTPLTFQTLSGRAVYTDLWSLTEESEIGHIQFADKNELLIVAPATANFIAKLANGIADDAPSTIALASTAPLLIAPAMNVNMLEHPATKENLERLRSRGVTIVESETGELACGWTGEGRLAEIEEIVQECEYILTPKDLSGISVFVTAGPTRERFDPVRFLSNGSTGKMGYELARAARNRGANVTLISGPSAESVPRGVSMVRVESAEEMNRETFSKARSLFSSEQRSFIFKSAAVTDFTPELAVKTKVKIDKSKPLTITFNPTPDILHGICELRNREGGKCTIVGFAAESASGEELLQIAQDKLIRKGADAIVANSISDGMGTETNQVWVIQRSGEIRHLPFAHKAEIAWGILDAVVTTRSKGEE